MPWSRRSCRGGSAASARAARGTVSCTPGGALRHPGVALDALHMAQESTAEGRALARLCTGRMWLMWAFSVQPESSPHRPQLSPSLLQLDSGGFWGSITTGTLQEVDTTKAALAVVDIDASHVAGCRGGSLHVQGLGQRLQDLHVV